MPEQNSILQKMVFRYKQMAIDVIGALCLNIIIFGHQKNEQI